MLGNDKIGWFKIYISFKGQPSLPNSHTISTSSIQGVHWEEKDVQLLNWVQTITTYCE